MRLLILAAGQARSTHEGELCDDFCARAAAMGKRLGFSSIQVEEVAISKLREADARLRQEGERLSSRIPEQAHVICLDAKGKGMTSDAFAEMLGAMRDAGARDLAFLIGGPDGLSPGPKVKPGRSLAFGPQTWPHLLVRAMLAEQIYRAITILAGHPYHRA
ncbi:MAG: 23S rRNA (pseudouridine(1915)-N(3))-methyltransferase RlmH [Alphaproteobacteria bacterium]|nr:23S rRNA (pseudouridine(1915)-N(3))-methyltransferase RlmH [Alphaproteobacteria bacterium]MBV9061365.1 23S rRNA (pseudouridine(1915)-N(3))-methyltransferase RlmH [Alphaproteobacteria bacterium]